MLFDGVCKLKMCITTFNYCEMFLTLFLLTYKFLSIHLGLGNSEL